MGYIGPKEVWLGSDESFSDMTIGRSGEEESGTSWDSTKTINHEPDTTNDHAEAGVHATTGHGSLTAWAWVGRDFEIQDSSGSQMATITAEGDYYGSMNYTDGGSNYVHGELIVEDYDDNEYYDNTIMEKSDYINENYSDSFTQSLSVDLQAGHTYGAVVKITAEISLATEAANYATYVDYYDDTTNMTVDVIDLKF